jgi:hypothetical protein
LAFDSQSPGLGRPARQTLNPAEGISGVENLSSAPGLTLLELILYLTPNYQLTGLLTLLCLFAKTRYQLDPLLLALGARLLLIPRLPPGRLLQRVLPFCLLTIKLFSELLHEGVELILKRVHLLLPHILLSRLTVGPSLAELIAIVALRSPLLDMLLLILLDRLDEVSRLLRKIHRLLLGFVHRLLTAALPLLRRVGYDPCLEFV